MKKVLIGVLTIALLAMIATPVFADTFPVEAGPGNKAPEIYLLESYYDICENDQWGGSRPYIPVGGIQDAQYDGCIVLHDNIRFDEYAFTGEQIYFKVIVRDLNGAPDIGYAYFTVGGFHEALCNDLMWGEGQRGWYAEQVPEKPFADAGFQPETDKAFECILTVEPGWAGELMISIEANDQEGAVTDDGIAQTWYFNPPVMIDLNTNNGANTIQFEEGYPGQTVMSKNKLIIDNLSGGGVDLWAFIAGDDLTDPEHSGAKCPVSNVLDIENMQFRCKIGTLEDDGWDCMVNKDTSDSCGWHKGECKIWTTTTPKKCLVWDQYLQCLGAKPVLAGLTDLSIIKNQASAECQFRLTYPVPCIGDFIEGAFHIIVRVL